ncbi:Dps family protein [Priestia taiwanensis]|uniref:DNA starvation/stationary phase protection protein n=1 Tax=Priestia taiwanensis TaxID=1347902 RepID=A0A917AXV5_9BACI|nr:Dps family protein [Priestia taiwanensis]GGE81540.1 DNA starvation/stationary phase protection protein [Priestia taiwanensis]
MNKQVVDVLNKQVANWNVLFVKLHNYHWYVKGPHFFTLHEKFEEFYGEAATHIDELAERILTLGGQPVATMKEYLAVASIEEATNNEVAEEMVQAIAADFEKMLDELKEGIEIAGNTGDDVTEGMLADIYADLEKHVWMLKAFLG